MTFSHVRSKGIQFPVASKHCSLWMFDSLDWNDSQIRQQLLNSFPSWIISNIQLSWAFSSSSVQRSRTQEVHRQTGCGRLGEPLPVRQLWRGGHGHGQRDEFTRWARASLSACLSARLCVSTSITLFVPNGAICCAGVRNIKAFNVEVTKTQTHKNTLTHWTQV